ncbi:helicase-related protein [Roseomonas mucosa]|uniref:helicase-related protein n=1 Tax=Roseomonas mucosa TaxID=207340 RepID=UPI002246C6A3|nr:helicase-related protein [Roseomonas mucosa]UZO94933.1 Superfamily II DNA/RNA helicase, SNF2 family [Roseomonas mucosa]
MSITLTSPAGEFRPGTLVAARDREWVVLPGSDAPDLLRLRPLGGAEEDQTLIYLPLEPVTPRPATFPLPAPARTGAQAAALLLRDALRLKLRAGAGPFRSFGNISVEPRAYQLVPLLMALKMDTIRLLIGDDVGIGKTVEAGLIARELLDRGEIARLAVICPPHLCEQWQGELASKFAIQSEIVRTGTAGRLERGLPQGQSIFDVHPFTVVSLDYIKSDRRRDEFLRACPEFVIVEEAHASVGTGGDERNQRLTLLRGLAAKQDRHMVHLTATPHSGDETAFHNLLGLLQPDFRTLQGMADGPARQQLRERLALHFVQRRRADIAEWREAGSVFPDRQTAEDTYTLSGEWGRLFDEVLDYARAMVGRTEGESILRQRMSWWAALALLRCVSSSPASAAVALATRLRSVEGATEGEQVQALDEQGASAVMDGDAADSLSLEDAAPAGLSGEGINTSEGVVALRNLLARAEALRGPDRDPKLRLLIARTRELIGEGFRPVIFCRFIQTAHYVAQYLAAALDPAQHHVEVITGLLPPEERRERINALVAVAQDKLPVLVATDCLSEGINLQAVFSAVVHYDLSWNPTRHEQREGRVDRFGQPEKAVRALMLYGENNPVDGAVLRVIVRKAERIRRDLGVAVPVPADTNKVTEAILRTVLLHKGRVADDLRQGRLDFGRAEADLETAWESAKENARQSITIFRQARLKPEEVLPEWNKAVAALGGEEDVRRFVASACERLRAPLEERGAGRFRLAAEHLPVQVRERLEGAGLSGRSIHFSFRFPAPAGFEAVHRTHPLVAALADHVAERALAEDDPTLAARCGAVATAAVARRTTVLLLRLRSQIGVEERDGTRWRRVRTLLSEEAIGIALAGSEPPRLLEDTDALSLLEAAPARNMDADERAFEVREALDELPAAMPAIEEIARTRAQVLLADHTRVRDASAGKGWRPTVEPCLPADVIGLYVLVPA